MQLSILDTGERKFFTVSEHGISFRPAIPKSEWLDAVSQLCAMFEGAALTKERTLMLLADALNYGEQSYGEEFAQSISNTRQALGLSPKTIANAQWVYGKIEAGRRKDGLTLGHLSVLASLKPDEQDLLMQTAIDERMTVTDLKEHVKEHHPKTKRGKTRKTKAQSDDGDTTETVLHKLSDCADWFMSNEPTEKMKSDMAEIHKVFRRHWQNGKAKKK